jgi:hypothetical protein
MIYADRQAGQSGKVYGMKVHVTYLPCAQVAGDAGAEKKDVYVGGPVKLELASPLNPVDIAPAAEPQQPINGDADSGWWFWDVRANKPGEYALQLVSTTYGPAGPAVNQARQISLSVNGSAKYYTHNAWAGTENFLAAIQGLILGLAGAAAAVLGLWPLCRKCRNSGDASDMIEPKSSSVGLSRLVRRAHPMRRQQRVGIRGGKNQPNRS